MAALPSIRELQRAVVAEVVAVAAADGVDLPLPRSLEAMEGIAAAMPAQLSSTAQDMARGKPSEIDHLNGFVARRGRELGVATPANQALHALVKLVESQVAMAEPANGDSRSPVARREFAQALRELGLAGTETLLGRPLTGGVSSDIWQHRHRARAGVRQARLSKLRVAADWRAPIERNLLRGALDAGGAARRRPAARAAVLGQHPRLGVLVMSYLEPARYALWKQALRDGHADAGHGARRRRGAGAHPRVLGRAAAARRASSPPMRSSSTSASSPTCWRPQRRHPDLAPALEALVTTTQAHTRRPGARRRQPEEHPGRPARAGAARCRVRLVGRPGVRHRLLPQPPAAEVPVESGAPPRPSSPASRRWREPICGGVDWEPREAIERRAAALLPGLLAGAGRRQVAGRIHHRRGRARRGCAASRGALLIADPGRAPVSDRRRLARGARHDESASTIRSIRARRVWDSRGRPTVEAEVTLHDGAVGRAISAGRRLARARARRSSCATAAPRVRRARRACARSATSTARSPGRSSAARRDDQAALDRRLIELDGTPNKTPPRRQRDAGGVDGGGARGRPRRSACRCTSSSAAPRRRCCRCRRSRSSAAARMPGGASTSRTSWSSAPARGASRRRSSGRPRSTATPAC